MKIFALCSRKALDIETQKQSGKFSGVSSSAWKPAWHLLVLGMRQERGDWPDGKYWVDSSGRMVRYPMASHTVGFGPLCLMASRYGPPAPQTLLVGRSSPIESHHKIVVCFLRRPGQPAVVDNIVDEIVAPAPAVAGAALSVDLSVAPSALVVAFLVAVAVAALSVDLSIAPAVFLVAFVACVPHAQPARHPRTQCAQ